MLTSVLSAVLVAVPTAGRATSIENGSGEIVVTGQPLPLNDPAAAGNLLTIDRESLRRSASNRMEDVLRDQAGLMQFRRSDSRSAHPTSQGASMRGLGGNASSRALILLDGVPMADPFGGWVGFPAFAPVRIGSANVLRGGGSVNHGAGAIAGTIALFSRTPRDSNPVEASIAYGSRDSVTGSAALTQQLGGGFVSLNGDYSRGDGFIPVIASQRGPADRAAPYRQYSLQARAVAPIADDTELQASGLYAEDRRARGLILTDNNQQGFDMSLRLLHQGDWAWEILGYYQYRDFSSGFASADTSRTNVTPTLDQYTVPAEGGGFKVEIRPPLPDGWTLALGGDGRFLTGQSRERYSYNAVAKAFDNLRISGGDSDDLGLFGTLGWEDPDAHLGVSLSGRVDRWKLTNGFLRQSAIATGTVFGSSRIYADRSGTEPTMRLGLSWRPSAIHFRAAAYQAWRLPTLNELYRPFRLGSITTNANAALQPERLRGLEAGLDYRPLNSVHLGATVFWNRLDDAIANVSESPTVRKRQNLDRITAQGFELNAGLEYGLWQLNGNYSYTRSKVRGGAISPALNGLRPAQTPRHLGAVTLGYGRATGPLVSTSLRYIGAQYEDDLNSQKLHGAVTVDGLIRWPLGRGLAIELRGENLADVRIESGIATNGVIERAAPRTLWIGLNFGG